MEPALPLRVPLHCTASRRVHALRTLSSGHRQRAWQCLDWDTPGCLVCVIPVPCIELRLAAAVCVGLDCFCLGFLGLPPCPRDGCLAGGASWAGVGRVLGGTLSAPLGLLFPGMRLHVARDASHVGT